MSILKYRYCPTCSEKTYHRYQNSLRCQFVACDGWECINCQKARRKNWSQPEDKPPSRFTTLDAESV